jgi:hypothetical protein
VIYEMAGMQGEAGMKFLRTLLSEGHIRYEYTVPRAEGDFTTQVVERPGPTGVILTTTKTKLHPEDETRLLKITVNDTPDQIRKVLAMQAIDHGMPAKVVEDWVAFGKWIAAGSHDVVIPYAEVLASMVRPVSHRIKRDYRKVLSLIAASALIHQQTRDRDESGAIVAEIEDYATVWRLIHQIISESSEATVPPNVRETVQAVERMQITKDSVGEHPIDDVAKCSVARIGDALGIDKSSASRRIRRAIEGGYLVNDETQKGKPFDLKVGTPMPEDLPVIPTPNDLMEALKKVA